MIPEEAVEAAAKAAYEVTPVELFGRDAPVTWEQLSESTLGQARREHELDRAKKALEAAAPTLMAVAFDQGQKSGLRHTDRLVAAAKSGHPELPGPISPNPYRPTQ